MIEEVEQARDCVDKLRKRLREARVHLSYLSGLSYCSDGERLAAAMALDALDRRLRRKRRAVRELMNDLETHDLSYDMVTRSVVHFIVGGRVDPFVDWDESEFRSRTRFNKDGLRDVLAEMKLLPGEIMGKDGSRCPIEQAVMIVLTRLGSINNWDRMQHLFNAHRSYLITIFTTTRDVLHDHYGITVTSFDFLRIIPQLPLWDEVMTSNGDTIPGVVAYIDGKAWRWCRPGPGAYFQNIAHALHLDVSQVQRAWYNGHYSHHGGKVQHVVFADAMVYTFLDSIRRHDAHVLRSSGVNVMLEQLFIDDPTNNMATVNTRPAYGYGDTAYPTDGHVIAYPSGPQRATLTNAACEAHTATNRHRIVVEDSFQIHVAMWPLANRFTVHSLAQNGQGSFPDLYKLWNVMVLFTNLRTCITGSQISGITGIDPPTVAGYWRTRTMACSS